jgi:glycosyltransferase involved in cell wall biosynthesis
VTTAIIAPSPVPFVIGGAEKLWWGMLHHFNQQPGENVELIKLPSPEHDFWSLLDSYKTFSRLQLQHFNTLISTKYPAWMVEHPNHYCYLQHKLRGLYDTYPKQLATHCDYAHPALHTLKILLETSQRQRSELEPLFAELERLKQLALPAEHFAFPGPLTRKIIHCLDDIGLAPHAIKKYAAISHNVAGRADYFPQGQPIQIIHHPSDLSHYRQGDYNTIFTVSRLAKPKRIDLLINAMRYVTADIQLLIAGSGREFNALQKLAAHDPRIKLLGRITDQQIIEHYANALFVPFIPYDEDYGLITIEAMQSAKAVLTTTDAGGVNEFVKHGETGLIVAPTAKALGAAMQHMIDAKADTIAMGKTAYQQVQYINWPATYQALIKTLPPKKPNIVVCLTFPVYPPRNGGQSRVYHLYKHLAQHANITLLTLAASEQPAFAAEIAPGLREVRIAQTPAYTKQQQQLSKTCQASVGDIAFMLYHHSIPAYQQQLQQHTQNADLVIACHPYAYPIIRNVWQGTLWYEAQDVELDMKTIVLKDSPQAQSLLQQVQTTEADCCLHSACILTCSPQDRLRLQALYQPSTTRWLTVENGVDSRAIRYINPAERLQTKQQLNLPQRHIALFMGSWHQPNIEALTTIKNMAQQTPDLDYFIVGSVSYHPELNRRPENVYPLGELSDAEKAIVLAVADIALNPIVSGSGTNLKLIEYAAAGIPVITTAFGLRGLNYQADQHVWISELTRFADLSRQLVTTHTAAAHRKAQQARALTEQQYDWALIASTLSREVKLCLTCLTSA